MIVMIIPTISPPPPPTTKTWPPPPTTTTKTWPQPPPTTTKTRPPPPPKHHQRPNHLGSVPPLADKGAAATRSFREHDPVWVLGGSFNKLTNHGHGGHNYTITITMVMYHTNHDHYMVIWWITKSWPVDNGKILYKYKSPNHGPWQYLNACIVLPMSHGLLKQSLVHLNSIIQINRYDCEIK